MSDSNTRNARLLAPPPPRSRRTCLDSPVLLLNVTGINGYSGRNLESFCTWLDRSLSCPAPIMRRPSPQPHPHGLLVSMRSFQPSPRSPPTPLSPRQTPPPASCLARGSRVSLATGPRSPSCPRPSPCPLTWRWGSTAWPGPRTRASRASWCGLWEGRGRGAKQGACGSLDGAQDGGHWVPAASTAAASTAAGPAADLAALSCGVFMVLSHVPAATRSSGRPTRRS
jgi:hypothetical protein